jgi:citrate synthase
MTDSTMTAREAAELLKITPATLYAYVSRGLVRSEQSPDDSRERRYIAEDILRLAERKAQRRDPTRAAKTALGWGSPVLESALTMIDEGGPAYRGHRALNLAQNATFEQAACLLWLDQPEQADSLFQVATPRLTLPLDDLPTGIPRMIIALSLASEQDLNAYNLRPQAVAATGARILRLLVESLGAEGSLTDGLANTLARLWKTDADLINSILILCADHELNASAFAARVAASAQATPYAAVTAGLATLQGFKHGGQTRRVAAFIREVHRKNDVPHVLRDHLQRGETIPGFHHPLYPAGDPRARLLLDLLRDRYAQDSAMRQADTLLEIIAGLNQGLPTLDFGLVTAERVLRLPEGSALDLFAIGRTAGWIAHIIEQYQTDRLIRPRATYTGPQPEAL